MNQDIAALEAQLVADGKVVLAAAKGALVGVVQSAGQTAVAGVQPLEDQVIKTALDFVPSAFRAEAAALVSPFAAAAEAKVNPVISADIQKAIAVAVARIDAIL